MSLQRPAKQLKFDDDSISVTVVEIGLAEIRGWMDSAATRGGDLIDEALFEDFAISDLCVVSDATPEVLNRLTPREIRVIHGAARDLNPVFFECIAKIRAIGRAALAVGDAANELQRAVNAATGPAA